MWTFEVQTQRRVSFVDVTRDVAALVRDAGDGAAMVFVPHTTAGVTINEDADPSVRATSRWRSSASCRTTCPSRISRGTPTRT